MPITSNVATVDLPAHLAAAPSPLAFTGFDALAVVGMAGSLILLGLATCLGIGPPAQSRLDVVTACSPRLRVNVLRYSHYSRNSEESARTMYRSHRLGIVGLICLFGVVGAGCSSPHRGEGAGPSHSTTSVSSTDANGTNIPYVASRNARFDVTTGGACLHEPNNSWALYGAVVNPTSKKTGFTIVVDFVTQPGDTVLDTQIVNVRPVAPHKMATWGAAWVNPAAAVGCVIRQAEYS